MASLAATLLHEYRSKYAAQKIDLYEHRISTYGAFEAFRADTPNLVPDAASLIAARTDGNRTTKVPVYKRLSFSIGSTRVCTAQTKSGVSALVTVTYVTVTAGFHMIPAQFRGNELAYQDDFNKKMDSMQRDLASHLDSACLTKLGTIKSSVFTADGNPYDFTSSAIVIPAGEEDTMWGELKAAMWQDDFTDTLNFVSTPRLMALLNHQGAQGPANDENLAYQMGGMNFRYTNNLSVSSGSRDTFYMYQPGSLGILTWVDVDSQMNHKATTGVEWSQQYLPKLGLDMGLIYRSDCGDQTTEAGSGSGYETSLKESFLFSMDYALVSAYNSDTSTYASPVFQGELLKA